MAKNELSFDDFKKLASDASLSRYEKIGFPDSYRKDKEQHIFADMLTKLPLATSQNKTVIDIGCGCSDLVFMEIDLCQKQNHHLILVDSKEMLDHVPDQDNIEKVYGLYPQVDGLFEKYAGKVDMAIAYSLMHYVFNQSNMFGFIHQTIDLLAPGGYFLIGDIPNVSKRARFLQSDEGKAFAQNYQPSADAKGATNHESEAEKMDDSIVMAILQRFRNFNCETYLLPQASNLPMANRREDILIIKR